MNDKKALLSNLTVEQRARLMQRLAEAENPLRAVENRSELPLSFSQQRLWFLNQLEPGGSNYNILRAYRIRGPLDVGALRRAINEIIRRHESLRTTFAMRNEAPVQVISPQFKIEIPSLEAHDEETLNKLIMAETNHVFDLRRGPLIRATVIRMADRDHVLSINQHHIISDGWSLGIIINELTLLYAAYAKGESSPLADLGLQFADFAVWQHKQLDTVLTQQLDYWKQRLASPPALDLPADRPRPNRQRYRGALLRRELPAELTMQLKALAQQERTTLFMLLMAVFQVLLFRHCGQEDFTVGTPIAGRSRSELEGIIGFFVNTLVIRADTSGAPTFRELLNRVRTATLEAFTHQDMPFEKLVEELLPKRDLSRNPLFQVMLALQNTAPARLTLAGAEVETLPIAITAEKFDLSLHVEENADGLECSFSFNTDLFDRPTIERLAEHFENLLAGVVRSPDLAISALPLLAERERRLLVTEWNDTGRVFPTDKLPHLLFERQAEATPNAVALAFEDRRIGYGELNARANRLAHTLTATGLKPETPVGLCLERSVEMVVAILAILKAGAAYVPLDPAHPVERISGILADAGIPVLLCNRATADKLAYTAARMIRLDSEWPAIATAPDHNPTSTTDFAAAAYIIYTSGSTGAPKGVINTHAGLSNRLWWMQETFTLSTADAVLQKTPYSFDVSVWEFLWPLMTGACLVLAKPGGHKDPTYLAGMIEEHNITVVHFVPSMLSTFLDTPGLARQCRSLRYVMCSGETLSPELVDRYYALLDAPLHNLYGPTEVAIDVTHWPCPKDERRYRVPIGRPIANTSIYLLDQELNPVPIGVAGELHIGGIQVARGYLNRPKLTRERFIKDPFRDAPHARLYKTGDLARYLPDGNIEYLGRIDFQIKLRGFRVEPGEIESVLRRHAAVNDCVVVMREESSGDQRLVAYVVPTGDEIDIQSLISVLKAKLPAYMVPTNIIRIDAFPLTPSGKLDRKALPAPTRDRRQATEFTAPRTPYEIQVARIWTEHLSVEQLGVRDNFFELGGHSLLATRVMARINSDFGIQLPLRELFENPTIEGLAQAIITNKTQSVADTALMDMLTQLESISDAEAERLLKGKSE